MNKTDVLPVTSPYTSTLIAMLFFHVCGMNRTNLACTGFEILFIATELLFLFPLKTWDEINLIYFPYQEIMTASANSKVYANLTDIHKCTSARDTQTVVFQKEVKS